MTLGNMRDLGVHRLVASCLNDACRHVALIDVSAYPAETACGRSALAWSAPCAAAGETRSMCGRTGKSSQAGLAMRSVCTPVIVDDWAAFVPPFSFGWSLFRLLWVAGLGRRFERPNTGQRNRRGLSAAADALKPPIELGWFDPVGRV